MKWTQVLATGFSTIGLFASTTYGSIVPLSSASSTVVLEDIQGVSNRSEGLQEVVKMINPATVYSSGMVDKPVMLPGFSITFLCRMLSKGFRVSRRT